MSDGDWNRLHPAAVAIEFAPRLFGFVRSFWPIVLAVAVGGAPIGGFGTSLAALGLAALAQALLGAAVHQATFAWHLSEGRLTVRSGLFDRQVRVIAAYRVQNVETIRGPLHRLLGVVELRIETASGSEVEVRLAAVDEAVASGLVARLLSGRTAAPAEAREEAPILRNGWADLVRYGMASGRTGAVALVFGGLFELVQFRDPEALGALVPQLGGLGAVALVGIALTGVWWIGIVLAILQHHDFRLSMRGDALIAEGGLWVRRRVDLTGRRIQSVSARQGWIARRLGFWTFAVETAAAREGAGGLERAEAIVPVVDDPQALLARLAPDLGVDPWSADWRTASPRAAPRAVFAAAVRWSIPAAIATAWLGGGAAGLWLLPLWAGFVALRRVRAAGWLLTDRHILVRGGLMRRHVVWAPRSRVQAIHLRQGPWLRRLGLAIVDVRLAGSAVTLPLLELVDARAVLEALLGPTASEVAAPEGGAAPGAVG